MLSDIFSSFDDQNQVFMSGYMMVWFMSFLIILFFNLNYWIFQSSYSLFVLNLKGVIFSQINRVFGVNLGGFMSVVSSLFLFLIMVNLLGLVPYVFSPSSHLVVSLSLALPLWLSLILSGVFYSPKKVVGALLPMGAPAFLNPFLTIIETVSIIVRPLTLSVRLMANMSAGHIVLALLGNYLTSAIFSFSFPMIVLIFIQVGYTVFEVGISLIQAYIFCLLLSLYSDEHPHLDMINSKLF